MLLCRDCLGHLSYANIRAVLANVARSKIRYVLMTSFPGRGGNRDVQDGDWRTLDFQAPPFSFPVPRLTIVEECEEEEGSYAEKSSFISSHYRQAAFWPAPVAVWGLRFRTGLVKAGNWPVLIYQKI